MGEGLPLLALAPEELFRELERFRHQQRNSRERRRDRVREISIRSVTGGVLGQPTRSHSPVASMGFDFPDLSCGQVAMEDWEVPSTPAGLPSDPPAVSSAEPFRPESQAFNLPFGLTESELTEFLLLHPVWRPQSLVALLEERQGVMLSTASRDSFVYWFSVIARFVRMSASSLIDDIQSALARDSSGREAFELGMERLFQWAHRPSDPE